MKKRAKIGQPQVLDLTEKKVAGSGEMRGLTTWVPDRLFDGGEMMIPHTLGRRPEGFVYVRGTLPLDFFVTKEQRSRWTASKVFIYPTEFAEFESIENTIVTSSASVDTTFAKPIAYTCDRIRTLWGG